MSSAPRKQGSGINSYGDVLDPGNLAPAGGGRTKEFKKIGAWAANPAMAYWYDPPSEDNSEEENAKAEEARKEALRQRVNTLFDPTNQTLLDEEKEIGDATRGYHSDILNRGYAKAERNTRFNLARQSLLGGSEDSFQQGEVQSDRDLGATRIDEAVRAGVTGLKESREQARLQGVGLVNAGAGDEGVRSATAGLKQAFDNASTANKADLTGDLFAGAVDNYTLQNSNAANQALLTRYRQQLGTFFPQSGNQGGRVTPT